MPNAVTFFPEKVHILCEKGFLAVWLPEAAEKAVRERWNFSPGEGFAYHLQAQTLCMNAAREFLPDLAVWGCAPLPRMNPDLRRLLEPCGLLAAQSRDTEAAVLCRSYAILTFYPSRGGCAACALNGECSRSGQRTKA